MHSYSRDCAQLDASGNHFLNCKENERRKVSTSILDAFLFSSSVEGVDHEYQQSHNFQFVIKRPILKHFRQLDESISPWRCVITLCSALVSRNAWCVCAAWCIHAWRFSRSYGSDRVQMRKIRPWYLYIASPESHLYESSSAVKKGYVFHM